MEYKTLTIKLIERIGFESGNLHSDKFLNVLRISANADK